MNSSDQTVFGYLLDQTLSDGGMDRWWKPCALNRESAKWLVDIRVLKDSAGSKQLTTTPWKINGRNLQLTHLERKMIFQTSVIMFHVNLQGCIGGSFFIMIYPP